jgi:hypothetical protein
LLDYAAMNRSVFLAMALASLAGLAAARDGLTPQQERMRSCNTLATGKELQGAERRHFITDCLKGSNGNGRKLTAHQRKNEDCNRQARERRLEGAARRGFMSECVKPALAKQAPDREKQARCSREADRRRLDAGERRRYMAGCLDGGAPGGS